MLQALAHGPLDIIGDVHGEADALDQLLARLGYDALGRHAQGRRLVFVGDLCDRGPDTPRVFARVRGIVEAGHGQLVLGNHELNLLRGERKDGNDWFWGQDSERDRKYEPYMRLPGDQRQALLRFLMRQPFALERPDLRVVHAAWHAPSIQALRQLPTPAPPLHELFDHWEATTERQLADSGQFAASQAERSSWAAALANPRSSVPLLPGVAAYEVGRQMGNPLRVLTSGLEQPGKATFFAGGQWRFVERVAWWDHYQEPVPVVFGHFWRRVQTPASSSHAKAEPQLFAGIAPHAWHGAKGNVFCVDFSAGGRFHERRHGQAVGHTTPLTALRWPERTLVFDHGGELPTSGFGEPTAG